MGVITVTPNGLAVAFKTRNKATKAAIIKGLQLGAIAGKSVVIKASPVDEGLFRASWAVVMQPWGAQLINSAPHAAMVEGGSRPHRPPFQPIYEWVWRNRKKFSVKGSGIKADEAVRAIAWDLVFRIERRGTHPHWVVAKSLKRLSRLAKRSVDLEIRRHA